MYLPRDEAFGRLKSLDFITCGLKSVSQNVVSTLESVFIDLNFTPSELIALMHEISKGDVSFIIFKANNFLIQSINH